MDRNSIGNKATVIKDIPSINGILRSGSIVKIDEIKTDTNPVRANIRVVDNLGKIWWLSERDIVYDTK